MLSIKYQVLFTVTLQHDYYGSSPFSDLLLVPSEETSKLFKDYKIVTKLKDNVLTALIQSDNNEPFVKLNPLSGFRFFAVVNNRSFNNFSALKIINAKGNLYYFSNKAANKKNNRLWLSAPVPSYNNSKTYEIGTVVKNGGRVFECIKANSGTNKHDAVEGDFWRDIVVHQSNFLPAYNDALSYKPGDLVKAGTLIFECLKPNSATDKHGTATDFWMEIIEHAYISQADISSAETIATMDIANYSAAITYPTGVWVKSASKFFESIQLSKPGNVHGTAETDFWKEVTVAEIIQKKSFVLPQQTLAVIDIFCGSGVSADYVLLNGSNKIQERNYLLRFKNRSTTWKYISQKSGVTAITDISNVYAFTNPAGTNQFVSQKPIPLSYAPLASLKMNASINARAVELSGLQNPSADSIKLSDNTSNYNLFSEIYLNY